MPLAKLQFQPGVNRETTTYSNTGGWFDVDKVRFRAGFPEKIGGWTRLGLKSFLGTCRALHSWRTISLNNYVGLGTSDKYYIEEGQGYYDVTPLRTTVPPAESIRVTLSSVRAVGFVGEISFGATQLTGAAATGQVGGVGVNTNGANVMVLVASSEDLSATGSVGSVEITGNISASVTLEGVQATVFVTPATTSVTEFSSFISFTATDGSSTIEVTQLEHGVVLGDFVTFSGAESLGGNITADVLNQEYQVVATINSSTYTIVARAVSSVADITVDGEYTPVPVVANSSDIGGGGPLLAGAYQINVGLETSVFGNGWGAGTWQRGTWGSGADIDAQTDTLRLWTHDNFGEDLIINVYNGGIYYWDATTGVSTRAVELSSLPGASNAPTIAARVVVSDVDRHVIAFGCNPLGSSVQDPLLIRFSDQENAANWTPTVTNTAGDLLVGSGSRIVTAIETRQQILVFTDLSLHAMQYLGPPFTFGINMISENITIASPNCVTAVEDNVFWMGNKEFYVYSGAVQKLPCSVRDYVFSDFNDLQVEKVFCSTNTSFSEVWWFYPSASSDNVDRYVVYNYQQNIWYYGNLSRSAWLDAGVSTNPVAAGLDGYLYVHEQGFDDGSTNPETPITAYIQSSPFEFEEGNRFVFATRLIPDITFRNSSNQTPSAVMTLSAGNYPGGTFTGNDGGAVTKSASVPVEQFTDQVFVRLRGRSMTLRVESDTLGTGWRLGTQRVDLRPDGDR